MATLMNAITLVLAAMDKYCVYIVWLTMVDGRVYHWIMKEIDFATGYC